MIAMTNTGYATPESARTLDRVYGTSYAACVVTGAYLPDTDANPTPGGNRAALARSARRETA